MHGRLRLIQFTNTKFIMQVIMKKRSEETQTLRTGCSKAEPNFFNQLEMVTTFTYKPSLVRIDARNFELSW